MNNAFAYLPNDIIHDVVILAGAKRDRYSQFRIHYRFLLELAGAWGDVSRDATPIMFISNKLVRRFNHKKTFKDHKVTVEEAGNRRISHCKIDAVADYDLLRKVVLNLCESIKFSYSPHIPTDVLDMLGDRFSRVKWSENSSMMINKRNLEFLKRFLRFKSIRRIDLYITDLNDRVLEETFVEFVKKPTFERLINMDSSYLSLQVFLEADLAWRARSSFEIGYQKVEGLLNSASFQKMAKQLQITSKRQFVHPEVPSARQLITCLERKNGDAMVTMQFFNWFENEDKEDDWDVKST